MVCWVYFERLKSTKHLGLIKNFTYVQNIWMYGDSEIVWMFCDIYARKPLQ